MRVNRDYKERTRAELTGNNSLLPVLEAVKSRHIEIPRVATLPDSSVVGCLGSGP